MWREEGREKIYDDVLGLFFMWLSGLFIFGVFEFLWRGEVSLFGLLGF